MADEFYVGDSLKIDEKLGHYSYGYLKVLKSGFVNGVQIPLWEILSHMRKRDKEVFNKFKSTICVNGNIFIDPGKLEEMSESFIDVIPDPTLRFAELYKNTKSQYNWFVENKINVQEEVDKLFKLLFNKPNNVFTIKCAFPHSSNSIGFRILVNPNYNQTVLSILDCIFTILFESLNIKAWINGRYYPAFIKILSYSLPSALFFSRFTPYRLEMGSDQCKRIFEEKDADKRYTILNESLVKKKERTTVYVKYPREKRQPQGGENAD